MGSLIYKQSLSLTAAKKPPMGAAITERDFFVDPPLNIQLTNLNENVGMRFVIPPNTLSLTIGMGTVTSGYILFIQPDSNLTVRITNAAGTSQDMTFMANLPSIMFMQFTGIEVSNASTTDSITGKIFIMGDPDT